jgi:hypothetical protein
MRQGKTNWGKVFPVRTITREDLCTAGFPRWQVAGLSDSEMNEIAAQMGISYGDSCFQEDLASAIRCVLSKRSRNNSIGGPV